MTKTDQQPELIQESEKTVENATIKKIKPALKDQESIRVAIDNLDKVSALTEEIQVTKIAIDDHYIELSKLNEKAKKLESIWKDTGFIISNLSYQQSDRQLQNVYNNTSDILLEVSSSLSQLHKNMHRHINELTMLSNSLLDEVRTLRLIPASTLFSTFPRTVRDIAHELKKEVDLKITGDSVKIDKMVLEGLKDPIIHLLRNAIDHGIEEPAIRKSKGKPETGSIHIDVREEGDQIIITLSDDGAGINLNKIADTAISKHILTEAERKTTNDSEMLSFIFRPGFTTKEIITDVSGRGIGLDVVNANIDKLNGRVDTETTLDKGTTFHLRVPLTLASERGLLVQSGGKPFVVPINLVERVLALHPNEIIDVEGSQAIYLEKRSIPLRTLADILELPRKSTLDKNKLPIIVLKKGWHIVALFVEDILNEREIVIKRLQPPLTQIPCISGGTLAGNGQVIIVLNTSDLIDKALHITQSAPITVTEQKETKALSRPHILVVDDSITTRTLEKNILESKNYQVTVAVNGKEAWDMLQNQKFSLLITDVNMPIMDGFALTELVKQDAELNSMPVIIVTSLGSEAEKKRGVTAGANAYIVKNEFESDKLLQIVAQLV
jgi:chemotaxis protein histidine kinase CheA/CheY-like chemotaxis protein